MSSSISSTTDSPVAQLDRLLAGLGAQAASVPDESEFVGRMLQAAIQVTGSEAAEYWQLDSDHPPRLVLQTILSPALSAWRKSSAVSEQVQRFLRVASTTQEAVAVLPAENDPSSAEGLPATADNAAAALGRCLWLVVPVRLELEQYGMLIVFAEPHASPAVQDGWLHVLTAVREVSLPFFQRQRSLQLSQETAFWRDACRYFAQLQSEQKQAPLDSTIANEARRILQADRVWLLRRRGRSALAVAASGVSQVDRKGESCRRLEQLVQTVGRSAQSFEWETGQATSNVPTIRTRLQEYLDESHVRALRIVPITDEHLAHAGSLTAASLLDPETASTPRKLGRTGPRGTVLGWLVIEHFKPAAAGSVAERCEILAGLAGISLAQQQRRWGWWRWMLPWTWVSLSGRMTRALLLVAVIVSLIAAAGWLIPAEYRVEARGVLQPTVRHHLFAPEDGRVDQLLVKTGQMVQVQQPLLTLINEQLDLEQERLQGELQTAQKRLTAIEAARLEYQTQGSGSPAKFNELSAELEQIQQEIRNFQSQKLLVAEQLKSLHLRSPIAGQVLTWNLEQQLERRPVRRGERLLTVAEVNGNWRLELQVPDDLVGDLLAAQQRSQAPLSVTFSLASQPGQRATSQLEQLLPTTEVRSAELGPGVLAYVPLPADVGLERRAGTTVVAFIDCGQQPLAVVWFARLWRMLYREYWF